MYGNGSEYLNAEALRLRAERAEGLTAFWRMGAYVLALLFLAAMAAFITLDDLAERRLNEAQRISFLRLDEAAERADTLRRERNQCREQWTAAELPVALCSQQAANIDDARIAAERKFKVCLGANVQLVDALGQFDRTLKEQRGLISDAVDFARRCDAKQAMWVHANAR